MAPLRAASPPWPPVWESRGAWRSIYGDPAVIYVQDLMDEVVQSRPLQVAMLKLADMDDGGAPMVHAGYHFWFEPNKSTVRRMSCYGVFTDMPEVESPTIADIRQALGVLDTGDALLVEHTSRDSY